MEVNKPQKTAAHYVETLAISLRDITQSPELEFKSEPVQFFYIAICLIVFETLKSIQKPCRKTIWMLI
jgi:hypothetical protein